MQGDKLQSLSDLGRRPLSLVPTIKQCNWLSWYNGGKNSKKVKSIFTDIFIGFARCRIVRYLIIHQYNFVPRVLPLFRGKRKNPLLGKMLNKKAHWSIRSMSVWLTQKIVYKLISTLGSWALAVDPSQSPNVLPQVRSQLTTFNWYSIHELSCYEHWYFCGTVTSM